jgi:hypothetical protein
MKTAILLAMTFCLIPVAAIAQTTPPDPDPDPGLQLQHLNKTAAKIQEDVATMKADLAALKLSASKRAGLVIDFSDESAPKYASNGVDAANTGATTYCRTIGYPSGKALKFHYVPYQGTIYALVCYD